eukprot:TRINITY_DN3428_c0_g1_i1.p1 TRINITY_DN3428_c0_g1~~TRINITY_DN3428_c0_g1_i1.p1  ORF type:complete len:256 (+),score=80.59 TRINITY_DN3428_c0_g1_i1:180-947(+)
MGNKIKQSKLQKNKFDFTKRKKKMAEVKDTKAEIPVTEQPKQEKAEQPKQEKAEEPKQEKAEEPIKEKKEDADADSSDDEKEGEHHDHDHDHEPGKKSNRGEKKFKKAMSKLGMKQVSGINRVTIKRGKQVLLFIDSPEILKSQGAENCYVVFGEAKVNDFAQNLASTEAKQFQKAEQPEQQQQAQQPAQTETSQEKKPEQTQAQKPTVIDENKYPAETIQMVMDHCKCTKVDAIKALTESNGDQVNAILKLTGN